ncbi:MAG: N-6 DNA methylase, partial [Thermodesulfovibrionia bacterium]|nr:N-6 DNA methylase [Thermodesulfovibrionia bacterium]
KQDREKRENHNVFIECKEPDIKFPDGEKQLKAYVNATTTQIGVWTNGIEFKYWKRLKEPDRYEEKGYLPKYGQEYGDKKILKKELRPSSELQAKFNRIHNNIFANYKSGNKAKVFYQVIYLLFAKIQDEKNDNPECEFVIYDREWDEIRDKNTSRTFQKRIFDLFEQAKSREEFRSIFDGSEKIEIPIRQIAYVVSEFENTTVLDTDIKGEAFQAFLTPFFRGDAGAFFTPDPIKKLVVEMLEPEPNEVVLDPACGSSGFLVFTINYRRDLIKKHEGWTDKNGNPLHDTELTREQRRILRAEIREYAGTHIKGVDFDDDLTKVAKMYMVMTDDGHTGIHTVNSLLAFSEIKKVLIERGDPKPNDITPECADIITTNPPFGSKGKVEDPNILSGYDFGFAWKKDKETGEFEKGKLLAGKKGGGQVPDILFIERCLSLLKKGGRMGIVLPDGDLTSQSTEFVRAWLKDKAQIVAVVSLPQETFVPFGAGVKSSVLFLKKPKNKLPERYPIFFASLQKIGYDIRGRKTYKRNEKGEIVDNGGRVIKYLTDRKGDKTKQDPILIELRGALDTDAPEVLKEWNKFKKEFKSFLW